MNKDAKFLTEILSQDVQLDTNGRRESNRPRRISSPLRSAARWEAAAAARDATGEAAGEGCGGGGCHAEDRPRDGVVGGGGGDARGRGGNHKTLAAGDK